MSSATANQVTLLYGPNDRPVRVIQSENKVTPIRIATARRGVQPPPARRVAEKELRVKKPLNEVGVVDQVRAAFRRKNLAASVAGFLLGGFVPMAVYQIVHQEVAAMPWLWILVIGGLVYSATTVYKWGQIAFSSKVKSLGFVVLVEGTLSFSQTHALSLAALGLLIVINGIATGVNLLADQKENKA